MTRSEFIRQVVLDTICDDFENVDQTILREVADVGATCGMMIRRSEVVDALRTLLETGLAKAYRLSPTDADPFSGEIDGMPSLDVIDKHFGTYFYVTANGMNFHEADGSWWPFDDDGILRPDWTAPQG